MLLDKELFMLKPGFLLTPNPDMLGNEKQASDQIHKSSECVCVCVRVPVDRERLPRLLLFGHADDAG